MRLKNSENYETIDPKRLKNRPQKRSRGGLGAILEDHGANLPPGSAQNRKKFSWDLDFGTPLGAIWCAKIYVERHIFSDTSRHGLRNFYGFRVPLGSILDFKIEAQREEA